MKLSQIMPPSPSDLADWSDVEALQRRMAETVQARSELSIAVGAAKTCLEYDSDRRKRALARAMAAALAGGESAAKAEAEGRASESYAKELNQLSKEYEAAQQTVMEWEALKIVWSTCQSLLAMQRESVRRL